MSIIENIWVKRTVSVIGCIYGAFLVWLGYMSVFYKISYVNKPIFAFVYIAGTLVFLAIMLFARKQVFTMVLSIIMMVLMVPVIFMNLGDWLLIIPPAVVVLTMFFACGANDTVKTIFGTIFLLMYILGSLGFFIFTNLFMTSNNNTYTVLAKGVSATGAYRYYIYDVKDHSSGSTQVYVEPNDKDKDFGFVKFEVNGLAQRKYNVRNHEIPTVEWRDGDILYINNERCDIKKWKWEFTLH